MTLNAWLETLEQAKRVNEHEFLDLARSWISKKHYPVKDSA